MRRGAGQLVQSLELISQSSHNADSDLPILEEAAKTAAFLRAHADAKADAVRLYQLILWYPFYRFRTQLIKSGSCLHRQKQL
jgi:hypothetical protein